ncbi:MAG: thioredoxin family protein, partial [Nanoarchaeota archaeon]|nr:thioredoxin family protein [Nanoarchaeota archaeon]
MPEIIELVNESGFNDFVKEGVAVVDFFAEWCMPCVMMAPVFEEVADKFDGKVKFGKVSIDDSQELAQKFDVSSIPNFVLFK